MKKLLTMFAIVCAFLASCDSEGGDLNRTPLLKVVGPDGSDPSQPISIDGKSQEVAFTVLATADWTPITSNTTSPRRHWYVYNTVTQPLNTTAQSYVVRFFCRAGVIMYVNGQERYRLNVDDASVTAGTMITGGSSVPYWHTYTGPLSEVTSSPNTFAFDVVNAVEEERYEDAARLRDELRALPTQP